MKCSPSLRTRRPLTVQVNAPPGQTSLLRSSTVTASGCLAASMFSNVFQALTRAGSSSGYELPSGFSARCVYGAVSSTTRAPRASTMDTAWSS